MSVKARCRHIATFLLLVVLPLLYTPLTVDLRPQKALVFALALPFSALGAPSSMGLVSLLAGLGWLLASPDAPWTILAFFGAPTIFACLSLELAQAPGRVRRLLRRACIAVCVLALLGALGLLPLDTSAFHLPYRVLVGTLGNPNHLAAFVVLSFPLLATDRKETDKATRIETTLALVLGVIVVLLCRSHLALLALVAEIVLFRPKSLGALALAAASLSPLLFSMQSFLRALEGRLYLVRVHASGFSLRTLLVGVSPSELSARFLEWQAVHLENNPADLRFWTFPEHPHNDLLGAALSFGLATIVLALLLLLPRFVVSSRLDRAALRAGLGAISLFALGLGLSSSPVLVASTLLFAASALEPREKPSPRFICSQTIAASAWFLVMLADAYGAYEERCAVEAASSQANGAEALEHAKRARLVPFDRARKAHLFGRALLLQHEPEQAAVVLREAAARLPHPTIYKSLLEAEEARGDKESALSAARAWLRVRPLDAEAREALSRHSRAK